MFRNPLTDALIILVVVLLIFGPKRLPTLGRSLGEGFREFKDSITGSSKEDEVERAQLNQAPEHLSSGVTGRPPVEAAGETSAQRSPVGNPPHSDA